MLMTFELLELQFAATLEVNVTCEPVPPLPLKLMLLPDVQLLHVIVIVVAPTVTVDVPVPPLYMAVMVTPLVVVCLPVTTPVLLTETILPVVSELSHSAEPVTS